MVPPTAPAPFSFHCVICFETFDHDVRYPVVLPCGHTFLCQPCSARIKRCMECRTSLFLMGSGSSGNGTTNAGGGGGHLSPVRGRLAQTQSLNRRFRSNSAVPTSPTNTADKNRIRLPLPKNLLLLTLMDVAEQEAKIKQQEKKQAKERQRQLQRQNDEGAFSQHDGDNYSLFATSSTGSDTLTNNNTPGNMNYETNSLSGDGDYSTGTQDTTSSGTDDERVWCGISAANSACGTYAVAEKNGLVMVPPSAVKWSPSSTSSGDGPKVTLVDSGEAADPSSHQELHFGDRVQVVDFQNGCAMLARGVGFVMASSSQLVKVEGPKDKACQIEGLILAISKKKHMYHAQQEELSRIEHGLQKELKTACKEEMDYTILPASPHRFVDVFDVNVVGGDGDGLSAGDVQISPLGGPSEYQHQLQGQTQIHAPPPARSPSHQAGRFYQGNAHSPRSQMTSNSENSAPSPRSPPAIRGVEQGVTALFEGVAGLRVSSRNRGAAAVEDSHGNHVHTHGHGHGHARFSKGIPHDASPTAPNELDPIHTYVTQVSQSSDANPPGEEAPFACGSGAMFSLFSEDIQHTDEHVNHGSPRSLPHSSLVENIAIEIGDDGTGEYLLDEETLQRIRKEQEEMGGEHPVETVINFRTGMSGHRALGSNKARKANGSRYEVRMMSEHRGIGRINGAR